MHTHVKQVKSHTKVLCRTTQCAKGQAYKCIGHSLFGMFSVPKYKDVID